MPIDSSLEATAAAPPLLLLVIDIDKEFARSGTKIARRVAKKEKSLVVALGAYILNSDGKYFEVLVVK